MNYYLIIIFLVSTFILLPILNFNLYGYEVSNVNYLNETKHVGFVPIKSKILPQYEEVSDTQSKNQTKPQSDMPANDIHKSNNSDESDESAQQPITQVKSQTEVKANDNNKSNNSEDVIVTVVSSDGSEVKPQKDSEANDNNKSNNSDESDESAQQPITQVKSQTEVKANDNNKSNNSDESVAPSMGVKILSPVSGKEIPAGTLTIFGISSDSEKSNCRVFVDWNNQKPFQEATAAGPYGKDDYSSWTFTYSPSYHTIENGLNELTSKLECEENSKVTTKWHSINVTGVITNDTKPTTTLIHHDPLGILPQLKTLSTNPTASTTGTANNETTISTTPIQPPTKLSASVEVSKDQIFPGDTQNITVKISDSKTLQHVAGANIDIKVMQGSTMLNEYKGTADASGTYSYSWISDYDVPSGKYDVLVSASANGHEPVLEIGSFQVQRQLLVEASLLKGLLVPGDKQAINVKVMDANTKEIVSGANVMAKIGENNEYNGTADTSGKYSYSWNIGSDTPTGKYDVLVSTSANGYEPVSKTASFQVERQLLVEASLLKGLVVPGDKQAINVKVMDANTKEIVTGAAVNGKIGTKKFSSNTDDTGAISYSWDTSPTSGGNSYQIGLDVSSKGYPKLTKTVSFKMDKPQNLLAPPISNQENKVVNVNNKDLKNDLESQNKFQECSNRLSNIGCSTDVGDKPIPNPNTDDKPIPNPNTDDKPIPNPNTDDKPIPDTDNGIENIRSEKNENENNGYDFLASISN